SALPPARDLHGPDSRARNLRGPAVLRSRGDPRLARPRLRPRPPLRPVVASALRRLPRLPPASRQLPAGLREGEDARLLLSRMVRDERAALRYLSRDL